MSSTDEPIRITDPVELVSVIPYLVGFAPEQSLTITALRGPRVIVVARLELPSATAEREPLAVQLRRIAAAFVRNGVQQAVLVAYGHGWPVTVAVDNATRKLAEVGITVQNASGQPGTGVASV